MHSDLALRGETNAIMSMSNSTKTPEGVTNEQTDVNKTRTLGSLSNVRDEHNSPRRDEGGGVESGSQMIQRCVIVQRDEKGYGLTVSGDNPVFVQSVKPEGAAHRAGVQEGDRIIKVNGSCVTNSNHTDVVRLIKSGSYVALTLLGKPPSGGSNRDSTVGSNRDSFIGSNRDSIGDRQVTAPKPVNAEKDKELREQKINTLRVMLTRASSELEKLKRSSTRNPSEKSTAQLADRERTVKTLEIQIKALTDQPEANVSSPWGHKAQIQLHLIEPFSRHGPKHLKHRSVPAGMFPSGEMGAVRTVNVARSKSDAASRQPQLTEQMLYRRAESSPEAASLPTPISDGGSTSDSPQTSPNTSPTPLHPGNLKTDMDSDSTKPDSGIDESSQGSVNPSRDIIGMDDDEFESEEEHTDEHGPFGDIKQLENKPAHMAIFLHYLISNSDPSALFFYLVTNVYSQAQGGTRDLRKWAYEIHSTFLVLNNAPLKVNVDEDLVSDVDKALSNKTDKDDALRGLFDPSRTAALSEIQELLQDFRQKKDLGARQYIWCP
ncbi:hypothetical protein ScPMuIL_003417 [Solemya velum]